MLERAAEQVRLERELGAGIRSFPDVERALKWYAETHAGPAPLRAIPLELGPGPRPSQERAERDATWFAINRALAGLHHAHLLVEWHQSWRSPASMARDEGFPSEYALRLTMRWTERLLAARMRERGLLA